MHFTVLDWNVGGAKFLEEKTREAREQTKVSINNALSHLVGEHRPDVITLQEVVRYRGPNDSKELDVIEEIYGYTYIPFKLIDTKMMSSMAKWNKVTDESDWEPGTYFAQGNAFLVKDGPHRVFPVWDLSNPREESKFSVTNDFVEHVHLESGLYFGDRNTEPRAALVIHFVCSAGNETESPVDVFVVNLHLTTLMKEREGVPEIDELATRIRIKQLEIVFNGIVSRYNSWRQDKYTQRGEPRAPGPTETFARHAPVWILAGDFNFTEDSEEYAYIMRRNFFDMVMPAGKESVWIPQEGRPSRMDNQVVRGTKAKGVGNPPTLTLDYVFAGPLFVSISPMIRTAGMKQNVVRHDPEIRASDHYPVIARIEFTPLK